MGVADHNSSVKIPYSVEDVFEALKNHLSIYMG